MTAWADTSIYFVHEVTDMPTIKTKPHMSLGTAIALVLTMTVSGALVAAGILHLFFALVDKVLP